MNHKEFVEKYKSGELDVFVNRIYALRMINAGYLPKRYFWANTFWSWVWFLSIPFGIIMLFFNIGIGTLILFFVSFLGGKAVRKSAMEFVLEHALEDEKFFKFAIEDKVIVIESSPETKIKTKEDQVMMHIIFWLIILVVLIVMWEVLTHIIPEGWVMIPVNIFFFLESIAIGAFGYLPVFRKRMRSPLAWLSALVLWSIVFVVIRSLLFPM